jgi:hypothetical protein
MNLIEISMYAAGGYLIAHYTVMPYATRLVRGVKKKTKKLQNEAPSVKSTLAAEDASDDYPLNDRKFKIESPEELLADFKPTLRFIQNALSMQDKQWEEMVMPTIKSFAGFVQKVPASESNHHRFSKGLLAHSLEVGRLALISYQVENFLNGYAKEERKFMEQKWALALFYAALLHDIAKVVTDIIITDPSGRHRWNGISEDIYTWAKRINTTHYTFAYDKNRSYENHELVNNIVTSRIINQTSFDFIAEKGPEIVTAMLFSLTGQTTTGQKKADKLIALVKKADGESVKRDKARYVPPSEKQSQTLSPMDRLIDVFANLLRDNADDLTWGVNQPGSGFYVSEELVFVVWESKKLTSLKGYLSEHGGNEDLLKLPDVVLSGMLNESGVFFEKQNRTYWSAKVQIGEWATRLNLSIITHPELIKAAVNKMQKQGFGFAKVEVKDSYADLVKMPYDLKDYLGGELDVDEQTSRDTVGDDEQSLTPVDEAMTDKASVSDEVPTGDSVEQTAESIQESLPVAENAVEVGDSNSVEEESSRNQGTLSDEESAKAQTPIKAEQEAVKPTKKPEIHKPKIATARGGVKDEDAPDVSALIMKAPKPPKALKAMGEKIKKNPPAQKDRVIAEAAKAATSREIVEPKPKTTEPAQKQVEAPLPPPSKENRGSKTPTGELTVQEKSVKERINPASNPAFKRLEEQGSSGPILCTVGVNLLLNLLEQQNVFKTNEGYWALVWPDALKEQGRDPNLLKEALVLESAVLPVEADSMDYIHSIKTTDNKATAALLLNPVFGKMFGEAFFDEKPEKKVAGSQKRTPLVKSKTTIAKGSIAPNNESDTKMAVAAKPKAPKILAQRGGENGAEPSTPPTSSSNPPEPKFIHLRDLDSLLANQIMALSEEHGWLENRGPNFVMRASEKGIWIKKEGVLELSKAIVSGYAPRDIAYSLMSHVEEGGSKEIYLLPFSKFTQTKEEIH